MLQRAAAALVLGAAMSLPVFAAGMPPAEFQFARLAYPVDMNSQAYRRGARDMWQTDWPDAEHHLIRGIKRLTRVNTADEGEILTVMDDALFDYPWLYAVEVGYWSLNQVEADRLREYLERGGFLVVDDFHGTFEWASFMESMLRVFPDRPVREIPESDESLHVLYDLDQRVQIPSIMLLRTGRTWERDGRTPHWRGIYDDDGRLMVAINFNMDIGDAWEHADTPSYPENMTALAYRFGISYIIYAMTH
ncbi:MAG: DUF4159 domain-containing protein [Pseudomonadota bacterium]